MLAVNYSNLRESMKANFDRISDDFETMIVTRKNNRNIVMMSEESYNNIIENLYVLGNKANYDWLMDSKMQLENGNISTKELIAVEADE